MCSIFGCFSSSEHNLSSGEFVKLNKLMHNRGPDNSDVNEFVLKDKILRLGHNRLTILDLSQNGNQPMLSQSKRFVIIYNGEIYNHQEIRKDSCFAHHKWFGTSDTETLLSLFEYFDIETILNKLEGMFSFCVYDNYEKKLIIARDRCGEKPMYISSNNNWFSFSSDLISIINLPNFEKKLDSDSLQEYIKYNYVPNPHSIFEGTFKLPPSSYVVIDLNKIIFIKYKNFDHFIKSEGIFYKQWWNIEDKIIKTSFDKSVYINHTEKILTESIKNRLISDVPLGAFLSGGIDSSLIVSIMQTLQSTTKTFTIGYENTNYDESVYAKRISSYLNTDHTCHILSKKDFIDIIPNMHNIYTEPFADSSQVPTTLLSKIARNNVKVVLSGDGGDELFGGYNRYLLANKYYRYIDILSNKYGLNFLKIINFLPKKFLYLLLRIINISELSKKNNNYHFEKIINKLKKINNKYSFYQSLISEWEDSSTILINHFNKNKKYQNLFENESLNLEESMMVADFQSYLTDDILCKVDRSSMYSSLEARTPFLSYKLIEYCQTIPSTLKVHSGNTKIILKSILAKYLPEELFLRPKEGFAIPISQWMRQDLKNWVNDILSEDVCNKHNLFNYELVKKLKEEHFKSVANHEHKLWSLIQFNSWYLYNMA